MSYSNSQLPQQIDSIQWSIRRYVVEYRQLPGYRYVLSIRRRVFPSSVDGSFVTLSSSSRLFAREFSFFSPAQTNRLDFSGNLRKFENTEGKQLKIEI